MRCHSFSILKGKAKHEGKFIAIAFKSDNYIAIEIVGRAITIEKGKK